MTKYRKYKDPYEVDFSRLSIYGDLKEVEREVLEPGNEITVEVTDMDMDGRGIAKFKNYTIIIPKAVTGEKVTVRIMKVKDKLAYASVVKRFGEPRR